MKPKTILIVDDHPFCREVVEACVTDIAADAQVVGLSSLGEAREALAHLRSCDLLILDLGLSDSKGLSTLMQIREEWPDLAVLVISGEDSLQIQRLAQSLGARGYLPKTRPMDEIRESVAAVINGRTSFEKIIDVVDIENLEERVLRFQSLTPAQRRVLKAMSSGALNKNIAYELGISEVTVKVHVKNILSKLGLSNRTQAVVEANTIKQFGFVL